MMQITNIRTTSTTIKRTGNDITALHVENVVRSTLSYPNETSKECIQFYNYI